MARITSEDFLSLSPREIQAAQDHLFYLLGYLDKLDAELHTPAIQRALRSFYSKVKSEAAAGLARAGEHASAPQGPREADPPADFLPLSEPQLYAALTDLASDGIVFLACEEHARQVYEAAGPHALSTEMLSYSGATVRLARAS